MALSSPGQLSRHCLIARVRPFRPASGDGCRSRSFARGILAYKLLALTRQTVQAVQIGSNSAVKALRNALALRALKQQALILCVAEKGNLREYGWHIRPRQNDEGCLFHSPVGLLAADHLKPPGQGALNVSRELLGVQDLLVTGDFLKQLRKVVKSRLAERIFARRELH